MPLTPILPLSNPPDEVLVTVCAVLSLLIHFTVVFTETVMEAGEKALFCIQTSLAAGEPPPVLEEELLVSLFFLHWKSMTDTPIEMKARMASEILSFRTCVFILLKLKLAGLVYPRKSVKAKN